MPARRITVRPCDAPANPMINATFETSPSLIPKIAARKRPKPAKKARKAAAGQKEMLMPIAGKKPAKEAAKKPAARPQRKSA